MAALWTVMALFKLYLGLTGYIDMNGRMPSAHFISGVIQLLMAGGAYWLAKRLRSTKHSMQKLDIEQHKD